MSAALGDAFVEAYFRLRPDHATARGYAGLDALAPTFDDDALDAFRRATATIRGRLDGTASSRDPGDAIDRAVLESELAMADFFLETLDWIRVNPLLYVEAAFDAVEALALRTDLRPKHRRECMIRRLNALETLMRQMSRRVQEPFAPFHAAAVELLDGGLLHVRETVGDVTRDPALAAALDAALRALDAGLGHLLRRADQTRGFEAMGEERYRALLRHEHLLEMDLDALRRLAHRTLAEVARELPHALAAERALATPAPPPGFGRDDVLDYYRQEVDAVRDMVLARGLVTVPDGALDVVETPHYLQALLPGASYLPPPVYGSSRVGRFYLRPVPVEMDDAQRRDFFATVLHRRLRNLVAHEVYPGHHLQFLHAAAHPSRIRKVRDNDVMIEGWALYCEQLMVEQGLFDHVPSARPLRALRLRALRVLVDSGIHTGAMSLAQAADLMCAALGEGARPFVETEVRRYAAEPTQAMSYLVGREAVLELREAWRARHGPGADLRAFHDRFLAEGSIPIALIRRRMVGDLSR